MKHVIYYHDITDIVKYIYIILILTIMRNHPWFGGGEVMVLFTIYLPNFFRPWLFHPCLWESL